MGLFMQNVLVEKKMGMKKIVGLSVGAAVLGASLFFGGQQAGAAPADTATGTAGLEIEAGGLHLDVASTNLNPSLTLGDSGNYDVMSIDSLVVKDFTGKKEGWSVFVQSTELTEKEPAGGFAAGTSALKLPQGTLALDSDSVSSTEYSVNTTLAGIDNSVDQKYVYAGTGKGAGTNTLPAGDYMIVAKGLTEANQLVDLTNYAEEATPYEATVTFSLMQGNL